MKRKALIIGVNKCIGQDSLPGTWIDINRWERCLKTNIFGGWDEAEIQIAKDPSRQDVLSMISTMHDADYAFIAVSSHGVVSEGEALDYLIMSDGCVVSESEINPGNGKTLIILDSCRHVVPREILIPHCAAGSATPDPEIRAQYRAAFDSAIRSATGGTIKINSCSIGESAGEYGGLGGLFSFAICNESEVWAKSPERSAMQILTARECFALANTTVTRRDPNQNPRYTAGRRIEHFPIALSEPVFPIALA